MKKLKKIQKDKLLVLMIEIINIAKMSILPPMSYKFNIISIKISVTFCTEVKKNHKSFIKAQKNPNIQSNFEGKKQKLEASQHLNSRQTTVVKTASCWYRTNG